MKLLLRTLVSVAAVVVPLIGTAQPAGVSDDERRWAEAQSEYYGCVAKYAKSHARVNASAADIGEAATVACADDMVHVLTLWPSNVKKDGGLTIYETARRQAIYQVVEARSNPAGRTSRQ